MKNYIIYSRYGNAGLTTTTLECDVLYFNKRGKIKEVKADKTTIRFSGYIMAIKLKNGNSEDYVYNNPRV